MRKRTGREFDDIITAMIQSYYAKLAWHEYNEAEEHR